MKRGRPEKKSFGKEKGSKDKWKERRATEGSASKIGEDGREEKQEAERR